MSGKSIRALVQGWETVRFELLKTPISRLHLAVEGSPVEKYVRRLRREMETQGFRFKPDIYLTDEWGCPDRTPVIGVPFYLADARLIRLEEEQAGEVEDGRSIMMFLRHEAGHAVNYAYRLWRRPSWARSSARSPSLIGTPSARTGRAATMSVISPPIPTDGLMPKNIPTRISPRPSPSG